MAFKRQQLNKDAYGKETQVRTKVIYKCNQVSFITQNKTLLNG